MTMAGKRKPRRMTPPREDLSKPSPWRLQHGVFDEGIRGTDPDTGTPILHRRAVDTLGTMLANGTITREMHDAGVIFRSAFQRALLDGTRVMSLLHIPAGVAGSLGDGAVAARERVAHAIAALGGFGSPAGSIAWHVIGLEHSIRDWALRQGWSGRPMHPAQAQGTLMAALGTLAAFYGLTRPQRAA
jgi:hypothetical protein